VDGDLKLLAIFDKPDRSRPIFEETIYITPSRLSSEQQTAIHRSAMQAIRAIGLSHGPVHAEFRVNERVFGRSKSRLDHRRHVRLFARVCFSGTFGSISSKN